MSRFTLPRDIYYGKGSIDELKNLKGQKRLIVVVGGGSMKRFGFLRQGCQQICTRPALKLCCSKALSLIRL